MKIFLLTLIITLMLPSLSNALDRDITIMRSSVAINLITKGFLMLQKDYDFSAQFRMDLDKLSISYMEGKEFNNARDRYIYNKSLSFNIGVKENLYENEYLSITIDNEFIITKWQSKKTISINPNGYIFTIKPMIIYTFKKLKISTYHLYAEAGSGISYMDNSVVEDRQKSTQFQFSDSLGFGIKSKKYILGYRFTHISNLNIQTPNPSIDFHQFRFSYRF